jgi:hypothetical protein
MGSQQWKTTAAALPGGRRRQSLDDVLIAVRSFYLNLQSWAVSEPEGWAQWTVSCPVRDALTTFCRSEKCKLLVAAER